MFELDGIYITIYMAKQEGGMWVQVHRSSDRNGQRVLNREFNFGPEADIDRFGNAMARTLVADLRAVMGQP